MPASHAAALGAVLSPRRSEGRREAAPLSPAARAHRTLGHRGASTDPSGRVGCNPASYGRVGTATGSAISVPTAFLIALGFFYGFITAADSAIYSIAVVELAPKNRIGSTQAIQFFIGFGIGAIAPVAAGSILDVATSASRWGLAFSFNGALAVLGVGALLWLRRLPKARQMASGKR